MSGPHSLKEAEAAAGSGPEPEPRVKRSILLKRFALWIENCFSRLLLKWRKDADEEVGNHGV